jgi:hypothetical protein
MGAAASLGVNLSDERQFALYLELKKEYESSASNGKSEAENFHYYKAKYDDVLKSSPAASPSKSHGHAFCVGDIVDCGVEDGGEGIIVDKVDALYRVDVGHKALVGLPGSKLRLVLSGLAYEVGDKVQVRPAGTFTFFTGWVRTIHEGCDGELTYDVEMAGDEDDVEIGVAPYNMRKLLSHRLVRKRFKKIVNTVIAANKFAGPARSMASDAKSPRGSDSADSKGADSRSPQADSKFTESDAKDSDLGDDCK